MELPNDIAGLRSMLLQALVEIYSIKSGFEENFKFMTLKSPFLLWRTKSRRSQRDLGIEV